MRVRLSPRAQDDLRSAVAYLLERNPTAAVELKEQLLAVIDKLVQGEFEGPVVQLRSGRSVRSWPVTPYRIYYQRAADELRVLRVYHQARRPIVK